MLYASLLSIALLMCGCSSWNEHPDGPEEQFVEHALDLGIEEAASLVGVDMSVDIDFTPNSKPKTP